MEHSWELEAKKPLGVSLDPTDMRQVFFTNLLLLGFDTGAMESQYKIPFNRDMFALPNKKAFEVVMYFLFNKLDPVLCRETFRDCWPVIDKKVEQLFRKACNNWLTMIAKEEKDAHLPRIVASTFMSPGGDRFYQLMFNFSRYVILRTIKNDHGLKTRDMLQHPVLTPQNLAIDHVISESLKCGAVRHRKRFLEHVEDTVQVQQQWKEYASELVKDNRTLSKAVRDKERLVRDEIQKGTTLGGSPVPKRRSGIHDPALDVHSVKRAQKVQKVRELWKILDDFNGSKEQECEVIESILHGTLDQYKIDAGEINVKIPDLLLRECESELQRRNVDNTLKGGKLNLLSLVHLWNLSLHLYIEKLHTAGVPNFGDHLATVATQVHTHHAYLSNTQALRSKMAKELIPNLKASIDQLKHSLDQQPVTGRTPHGIRTASLGLGLLPPTPPISFQEDSTLMEGTPPNISTTLTPNKVSTPEAVSRLVNSVEKTVRREQASLGAGTPLYGPKLGIKGQPYGADNVPMSHLPVPVVQVERVGNKQRTRIRSAPGTPGASRGTLAGTSPLVMDSRNGVNTMFETLEMETTQEGRSTRESAREKLTEQVSKSKPGFKSKQRDKTIVNTRRPQSQTPRVERHSTRTSPRAHDILADKIADAVMDSSRKYTSGLSSGESTPDSMNMADLNLQDPLEGLGTKAFISQDKIARTPEGGHAKKMTWHDTLMEEQLPRRPSSTELDEVTKNLFTPENSDEENIITVGEVPDEKKDALSPVAKVDLNQPKGATPSSKRKLKHSPTLLDMETVVGGQTLNRSAREAEERLEAASEVTNLLNDLTFNGGTVQEDMTWRKQSSSSDQSSSIVSAVVQRQDKSFRDSPISTEDQYRDLFESKTPHLPNRAKRQNVAPQDYSATPEFPKSSDHSRKSNPSVTPISTNDMPFGQFTDDGVQRSSAFSLYPKDLLSLDDEDDLLTTVTMPFSPSMEDSPHVGSQDVRMVVSPHVFGRKERHTELGSEKRNYDEFLEQKSSRSNARSPAASSTGSSAGFNLGHGIEAGEQLNNMKHVQKDSSVDDLISRYRKLKLNNFTPLESLQNNKSPSLSKHVNGSNLSSKSQQATTADVIDPRYFEKSPVRKTSIDERFSLDIDEPENILDFKSPGGSRLPDSPDYSNLLGQNGRSSGASEKPASTNDREEGAQSARSPHGFTMPVSPHDIALLPQDARGGYLHTPRQSESLPLDGSLIDVDAMLSPGIGETPGLPFGRKGRDSAATNKAKRTDRFEDILGDDTSLLLPSSPEVSFTTHSPAVGNLLDF